MIRDRLTRNELRGLGGGDGCFSDPSKPWHRAETHPAKCLCFFSSKCGLEANFKAALCASAKCSQKLWTRKIPANTQLCTVVGSLLNTNYSENAALEVVSLPQVLLGKLPLLLSHFCCRWRSRCSCSRCCCFQIPLQIGWKGTGFEIL